MPKVAGGHGVFILRGKWHERLLLDPRDSLSGSLLVVDSPRRKKLMVDMKPYCIKFEVEIQVAFKILRPRVESCLLFTCFGPSASAAHQAPPPPLSRRRDLMARCHLNSMQWPVAATQQQARPMTPWLIEFL